MFFQISYLIDQMSLREGKVIHLFQNLLFAQGFDKKFLGWGKKVKIQDLIFLLFADSTNFLMIFLCPR